MVHSPSSNGNGDGNGHVPVEMVWTPQQEQIRKENFFEIDGSEAMQKVFWQMTKVRDNSNVLITGESGTGKTNAARVMDAMLYGKPTDQRQLLEVNVAALPPQLIASELFGHEKYAFSGAAERRIGRFEQANKRSLLLDEVGEVPIEIQIQLLSALDKIRRIERVGSNTPIHPELLVICATTQNLAQLVLDRKFHDALHKRLMQKRIHMPSLKERGPDYIEHLIRTLLRREAHARNLPNGVLNIDRPTMKAVAGMPLPGNLRDIDFLIGEMAGEAYAAGDTELSKKHFDVAVAARGISESPTNEEPQNMEEAVDRIKKDWVLRVMQETGGNQSIAATQLGINRNTLFKLLVSWGLATSRKPRIKKEPKDKGAVPVVPQNSDAEVVTPQNGEASHRVSTNVGVPVNGSAPVEHV